MFSIEHIVAQTGYTKNSIYTISIRLGVKPKKGLVKGNPGKGLYNEHDLGKFLLYRDLISTGVSKDDAYAKILSYGP